MPDIAKFQVVTWGPERPPMTFRADSALLAYEIALNKAVYASLQVKITDRLGNDISLEDLHDLARAEADQE